MIRFIFFFSAGFFLVACGTQEPSLDQIRRDVSILASDSLEGREVGSKGEALAAEYIRMRFEKLGVEPKGTDGYFQPFFVKESQNPHEKPEMTAESGEAGTTGKNVIGFIDNPGTEVIVIGAHYDHLGFGGFSSLYRGDSAIHNGADDNASGVAALLSLAEVLTSNSLNRDILFIAFSGEEKGLWGSNFFVKNPTIDLANVDLMINLDMVGRLDTAKGIAISGTGTATNLPDLINGSNTVGMKVIMKESGVGPSDHTSFYLQDIPVLHYFTGQHGDYHKPTDDAQYVNYEGIVQITTIIRNMVMNADQLPKLTFQKTKDESEQGPKFTVTLGVVPDYLFDGKGMRIDGVSEDKPAQVAGLQKGDVVMQLGDSTVVNMMSYMRALAAFQKGDSTTVSVKRGEVVLTFKVGF